MSVRFLFNIVWCALLSCTISGCYSQHHYPYSGAYPGPYGSPGPYQMTPGTVAPGSIPQGSYPVQPDLGQPVPPPKEAFPSSSSSQPSNGAFPGNTGNTSYDGVDTQWKQPLNSSSGSTNPTPFQSNPTASGTNTNPNAGLNSTGAVPEYNDPNFGNSQTPGVFESNKNTPSTGGNPATNVQDNFGSGGDDPFKGNTNNPLESNDNSGFSVPQKVEQQSFEESGSNSFNENTPKFDANPGANASSQPVDSFNSNPPSDNFGSQPGNSFDPNPTGGNPGFEAPIKSFPENNNDSDGTFSPNSTSLMNPASGKVSHANHQAPVSGPQLVKSDQFMPPAKIRSASFDLPLQKSPLQTSAAKSPSPFSYDKQQYRWLRGIVEFDEEEKHWNITYNATPDQSDKFGGNIVLLDQGQLNRFTNGDVVLIDGHIDGSQQDKMGKPFYRVARAQKLVPKK